MRERTPERSTLTIHLMGGLGNQLFQYAFGRRLALANAADIVLDSRGYGQGGRPDALRGLRVCEIGDFCIEARIIATDPEAPGNRSLGRRIGKVLGLARRAMEVGKPYDQRHEIVEPTRNAFRYDPAVANRRFTGNLSIRGYWQSERYFSEIEPMLRKDLTLRAEPPSAVQRFAAELRSTDSVAVHVRHTDNANAVAASLGVLPREYYDKTMRAIADAVREPHFYVFSDDVAWAEQFLGSQPRITYVSKVSEARSSIDLYLMGCCRHHITANSTFSWWGAWLAKRDGQIVYAPARYYQNADRPNPDLYPAGWRLVET